MLRPRPHQSGFTLVELLVGVAVGSIVVAGVISVFASTAGHQKTLIEAARLQKELRSLMTLMTDDLRRAGYAALMPGVDNDGDGLVDITDLTFNPFLSGETDIDTGAKTGQPGNSCITYAYNLNEDSPPGVGGCNGCGSLPSAFTHTAPYDSANLPYNTANVEMFGFRLNAGQVESRTGFAASETTFDCNSGSWSAATGPTIQVTSLSFVLTHSQVEVDGDDIADGDSSCASGKPCQCIREVTIALAGQLSENSMVREQLTETVRVRNDKFIGAFDTTNPCRD